jgi:signal transduction histidine kinase
MMTAHHRNPSSGTNVGLDVVLETETLDTLAPACASPRHCVRCSAALHSGARIVNASDAERRRLERDLHDGAQQRLIYLAIQLRRLGSRLSPDSDQARLLAEAQEQLTASLIELRELASGLHPAALNHGLAVAVESLAGRSPVPVTVTVQAPPSRDASAEVAAYYVVSEALTNVAKYAGATAATVAISHEHDHLVVEVADDGVGGADPADGSGLHGLADRVEAIGGWLNVSSTPGAGTTVRAMIPCRTLAACDDTVDVAALLTSAQ